MLGGLPPRPVLGRGGRMRSDGERAGRHVVVDVPGVGSEGPHEVGPRGQLFELLDEDSARGIGVRVELRSVAERYVEVLVLDRGVRQQRVHLVARAVEPRFDVGRRVGGEEEDAELEGLALQLAMVVALGEECGDSVVASCHEHVHLIYLLKVRLTGTSRASSDYYIITK